MIRGGDVYLIHPAFGWLGRLLFTLIFFVSGVMHFTELDGFVALMSPAIPGRPFWVIVSGLVELAGAVMILLGWMPRLGGWLIVLFLIPVTVVVHGMGILDAPDETMARIQTSFFLKGLTMTGGALLITQMGICPVRGPQSDAPKA